MQLKWLQLQSKKELEKKHLQLVPIYLCLNNVFHYSQSHLGIKPSMHHYVMNSHFRNLNKNQPNYIYGILMLSKVYKQN